MRAEKAAMLELSVNASRLRYLFGRLEFVIAVPTIIARRFFPRDATNCVADFSPGMAVVGRLAFSIPLCDSQRNLHNIVFAHVFGPTGGAAISRCHGFGEFLRADATCLDVLLHAPRTLRSARALRISMLHP